MRYVSFFQNNEIQRATVISNSFDITVALMKFVIQFFSLSLTTITSMPSWFESYNTHLYKLVKTSCLMWYVFQYEYLLCVTLKFSPSITCDFSFSYLIKVFRAWFARYNHFHIERKIQLFPTESPPSF